MSKKVCLENVTWLTPQILDSIQTRGECFENLCCNVTSKTVSSEKKHNNSTEDRVISQNECMGVFSGIFLRRKIYLKITNKIKP